MAFFLEYGEDQRFLIKALVIIACVAVAAVVVLGVLSVKERITYINPTGVMGTTNAGYVPDEYAVYFGMTFLYFLGNVNKYSVEEQYKSAFQLMAQKLQSAMQSTLETEMAEIKRSNMSIETATLTYSPVVRGDNDTFTLSLEAVRVSYVMGQPGKTDKLLYTINCRKARTMKSNPFGLEVTSYENKVIASGDNITAAASVGQQ